MRRLAIRSGLAAALVLPVVLAAFSPYLAYRQPAYILGGFAGIAGLALMPLQPLLAAGRLPGLGAAAARRAHRWIGGSLVALVALHVAGLWITSPPDMMDALLFRAPTWFSVWGVVAMWGVLGAALLAVLGRRIGLRWRHWRIGHVALTAIAVSGTAAHALLIEGAMEPVSKGLACALALGATLYALVRLRIWARRAPRPAFRPHR